MEETEEAISEASSEKKSPTKKYRKLILNFILVIATLILIIILLVNKTNLENKLNSSKEKNTELEEKKTELEEKNAELEEKKAASNLYILSVQNFCGRMKNANDVINSSWTGSLITTGLDVGTDVAIQTIYDQMLKDKICIE